MAAASDEMDVFCRVAALGSFSAAAHELGLTPSAVSKVVSRTEDRLGVKLLVRTTRRLSLTSEGETYLARAQSILDAIANAEADVAQSSREPSGMLRINTGPTFGRHRLMAALPDFLERYPKIDFRLDITDRVVDLAEEQVDVAVRTGVLTDSRLIARKFMDASRIIVASPTYLERFGSPQTPTDLHQHKCLVISGHAALAQWPFEMPNGPTTIRVETRATSDNADLVRDMALAGMGIARLVSYTVDKDIAAGRLVPLLEDMRARVSTPVSAVMLPERQKIARVRAFVDFLVESFGR